MMVVGAGGENRGFSLLDLLIVMMIIGIICLLATPPIHSMISEAKLNEASGELVSGLQYARSLAVTHQRPFGLLANVGENWFKVFDYQYRNDGNPHHGETPPVDGYGVVLNPFDKNWYRIDFDISQAYEGVSIDVAPPGGIITFYPDGHSSIFDSTFVLSYGGDNKTILVDGTTGRINVN